MQALAQVITKMWFRFPKPGSRAEHLSIQVTSLGQCLCNIAIAATHGIGKSTATTTQNDLEIVAKGIALLISSASPSSLCLVYADSLPPVCLRQPATFHSNPCSHQMADLHLHHSN
jgi:hypothetical protein